MTKIERRSSTLRLYMTLLHAEWLIHEEGAVSAEAQRAILDALKQQLRPLLLVFESEGRSWVKFNPDAELPASLEDAPSQRDADVVWQWIVAQAPEDKKMLRQFVAGGGARELPKMEEPPPQELCTADAILGSAGMQSLRYMRECVVVHTRPSESKKKSSKKRRRRKRYIDDDEEEEKEEQEQEVT